jgi:serralysin
MDDDTIDVLDGVTEGADNIIGYGGDDLIYGFGGDDRILGGQGADWLLGGEGWDTATYWNSGTGVLVDLSVGAGFFGDAQGDVLIEIEYLEGSAHNDFLFGNGLANRLWGLNGNDELYGASGDDTLYGGVGADHLDGGSDNDRASYIGSSAGVDVNLAVGSGIGGEAQGDTYVSIEDVEGSNYDDELTGNSAANTLIGLNGDDWLEGGDGIDHLDGGLHDDILVGGRGADVLIGGNGSGSDTAAYFGSDEGVTILLASGEGHNGDAEGDTLNGIENVIGSAHEDIILGNGGANTLNGGGDADVLFGMGGIDVLIGSYGDDALDGGTGADTMLGGWGDDTYYVDNVLDVVTELAGRGVDTVYASSTWIMTSGSDIETLRTNNDSGTAAINLYGNNANNVIIGNNGANILSGGGGHDEMTGRGGSDSYFVDNVNDVVIEAAGQGNDAVRASVSYTLAEGVDIETLSTVWAPGTDAINLTANSSGNVVVGNNGMNWLNGRDGNDELIGNGGMDYFVFNTALNAASNVDALSDFDPLWDTIVLDDAIFAGLAGGGLTPERFVIGAAAQDANDRIIYNQATGDLMYDSDGTGATAAIRFAHVNPGTALTVTDFWVL